MPLSPPASSTAPPEQGQLVRVRNRLWAVTDTLPHEIRDGTIHTRVDLECLDDDRLGEPLSVLWEREVGTEVFMADAFPTPSGRWDHPATYRAFLRAIRWSSTSMIRNAALQAPFRGAIEIEPYQLEPVARAVLMPRVNLLIADDVGLGKTIEAGLVVQELLARARIRNCLIVCPASLQRQWVDEMEEKFNLEFRIIDREAILTLRREYGVHVNPWQSFPRLITSIDFLKQERVLAQLQATWDGAGRDVGLSWDLLILDEAHNCAPAGRRKYIKDSDRSRMLRRIAPHFQHRLFLTATPHNGFTESFTALLEELDPLRFTRGPDVNAAAIRTVMVRRLKEELAEAEDAHRPFPKRVVDRIAVPDEPGEREVSELLDEYIAAQMDRAAGSKARYVVQFALNLLKKRFLSSPRAFHESLNTHLDHVTRPVAAPVVAEADDEAADPKLTDLLIRRTREETDSDEQKAALEREAMKESTRFFARLREEDLGRLTRLWEWSEDRSDRPDAKFEALAGWLRAHLQTDGAWNGERLLLFTEYRDTLAYLRELLVEWMGEDRILTLTGGSPLSEREGVKAAFQSPPDRHPVRVLLATDAAAEGLNLQKHCRYLVHYEIPWNPNRLEQRNGRIDRHGQPAKKVFCYHFLHDNRRDSPFLEKVVEKVQQMRADLGSVSAVIEEEVERFMLGERSTRIEAVEPREVYRRDMKQALWDNARLKTLRAEVDRARLEWHLGPEEMREVLDRALQLEGHPGLEGVDGDLAGAGALLRRPPQAWGERVARSIRDPEGRVLTLVFDPEVARGRRDVALVHLSHPLMVRALGSFRKNLWSLGLAPDHRLSRVTYEVAPPGIDGLVLVADIRLLAVGAQGQKLHEDQEALVYRVSPDKLVPADASLLSLLGPEARYPGIPTALGERLAAVARRGEPRLREELAELARAREAEVERKLKLQAEREVGQVTEMVRERRDEITARLRNIRKQVRSLDTAQMMLDLPGWEPDELDQLRSDIQSLERRKADLDREARDLPEEIRLRYRMRHMRAFALGMRFLIPETLLEGAR